MTQPINTPIHKWGTCLDRYIPSFDAALADKNYKPGTIRNYRISIRRLASKMEAAGTAASQLSTDLAAELVRGEDRDPRKPTWHQNLARRFALHLIEIGVVPKPIPTPQETARAELRLHFEHYLRNQRGLCPRRIYNAWRVADRFLHHRFGASEIKLEAIGPGDVTVFLRNLAGGIGRFRNRAATSLLRLFLQYLFSTGATHRNLTLCIPKIVQRRYSRVPRYLPADQIERILDAVRSHPKHGIRGYAMILLMARLGLRAPEVIAIQLDDLNWRTGELLVRGKGGLHDRLPIPPDVGEALARLSAMSGYRRHGHCSSHDRLPMPHSGTGKSSTRSCAKRLRLVASNRRAAISVRTSCGTVWLQTWFVAAPRSKRSATC
jgi:integrase